MADSETVGQRFTQLIAHLGISKNAFAASLGKTATVIQHLVDERNKPGFDLLCTVFEVYPNVSKDWLLQGARPMLTGQPMADDTPAAPAAASKPQPATEEAAEAVPPAKAPAAPRPAALVATPALAVATAAPKEVAPEAAPEMPAPAAPATPVAAVPAPPAEAVPATPAPPTPAAAPPAAADTSWQTALYTQQMAHQLALAELRNQHLQDQQRLMQQMLDLMQRQLPR